jgi:hypothetical protein
MPAEPDNDGYTRKRVPAYSEKSLELQEKL